MTQRFDSNHFRHILGHYPTGVCAITSLEGAEPIAMIVGSFTSVSLQPPLVAFFPDRNSKSWERIAATGRFCVNILADHQQDVCRTLASREADKFRDIPFRPAPSGLPVIEGTLAWIDCTLRDLHEAGDHFIAVGAVDALGTADPGRPLLFFQGGYGCYSPLGANAP